MKKNIKFSSFHKSASLIVLLICLFACRSYSQDVAVVSVDKMNVFYVGVDNPVTIAMSNATCDDLIIEIANGTITGSNCKYIVRCDKVGICRIVISTKKTLKKRHSTLWEFRVKMIPKPSFKIAQYANNFSTASKKNIEAQEYVRASLDYFDFDLSFYIDSFHLRILRDSTETFSFTNKGNKIAPEIRTAFSKLMKGDIIVFEKIFANSPYISSSLNEYYNATTYDNDGFPVVKKTGENTDKYLKIELEPLTLKIED